MKRLCGYDVNGWRDIAVRNWVVRPGEEVAYQRTEAESGALPAIVRVGDGADERWIGGVQAELAPHGRGGGWGEFGKAERRVAVRSLLSDPEVDHALIAAALQGLADGAAHAVLAIDDTPQTTEQVRERLEAAMSAARIRGSRLLAWRPVLAALFAIDRVMVSEDASVGVVSQTGEGFSRQILRIRRADGREDLLAPERREHGVLIPSGLGYAGLVDASQECGSARSGALVRLPIGTPTFHRNIMSSQRISAFD